MTAVVQSTPRIIIAANTTWYLWNFRRRLIESLLSNGYDIIAVAPRDDFVGKLQGLGCEHRHIDINSSSTNPFVDARTLVCFYRLYRRERPSVVLHYTPKPNIYGSLAARAASVPCVNNISGFGEAFSRSRLLSRVVRRLYGVSQRQAARVFFQNPDDYALAERLGDFPVKRSDLLPGSGVDTRWFFPRSRPAGTRAFTFLLSTRLLWDKGVAEYAFAARALLAAFSRVRFLLLGFTEEGNLRFIPEKKIREWEETTGIIWLGRRDDVRPVIAAADCVVLPSYYREGVPRTLLEAASMAKPIITTDSIGCREVVDHGVNGYLCRPRDAVDLTRAMRRMIDLPEPARRAMGRASRCKAEQEFDESIVIGKYHQVIAEILSATLAQRAAAELPTGSSGVTESRKPLETKS